MPNDILQLPETKAERAPVMSPARFAGAIVHVALILFSSTRTALNQSEFAYSYYTSPVGFSGRPGEPPLHLLLHLLAEKSIHFVLFFSLGTWICNGLQGTFKRRFLWSILCCLLVGTAAEVLQIFTHRDAQVADVILDLASGALGAASQLYGRIASEFSKKERPPR